MAEAEHEEYWSEEHHRHEPDPQHEAAIRGDKEALSLELSSFMVSCTSIINRLDTLREELRALKEGLENATRDSETHTSQGAG
tara:strand:+ start:2806 stop:3054 length:249 start_codon:yes stop_codon:yes gene_type:complete